MRQEAFFAFVLIFAAATQTGSAEELKVDLRDLLKRMTATATGTTTGLGGLTTFICPLIAVIPTLGTIIGSILGCPTSTGGGSGMMPGMTMPPGVTMPPGMTMPTMMPGGGGSGMSTGGGSPMNKPLSSFNPLVCPLMSIFNSVPIIGPMVIQSVNPPLFGCMITGGM